MEPGVTGNYKLAANGALAAPDVAGPQLATLRTTTKCIRKIPENIIFFIRFPLQGKCFVTQQISSPSFQANAVSIRARHAAKVGLKRFRLENERRYCH